MLISILHFAIGLSKGQNTLEVRVHLQMRQYYKRRIVGRRCAVKIRGALDGFCRASRKLIRQANGSLTTDEWCP